MFLPLQKRFSIDGVARDEESNDDWLAFYVTVLSRFLFGDIL